ncbi:MAG: transposase family protein [Anaerolineae bacterium]
MTLSAFDELYAEFAEAHAERIHSAPLTRRTKTPRQRAVGAGRKHRYDLRDRLLMTLFWLRAYMTYEVLGFFYDLHKTNIEDNLKDVLATLETMTIFTFERPSADQPRLRSPQAVMDAFPEVRLVIDAKEQRVRRPKGTKDAKGQMQDHQKPYYSGKKKAHTLKTQIAVRPDGLIEAVSQSVPGGATHDITLLRQTDLLAQLGPTEAGMLDKGYDGISKDYPDVRLYLPFKARRNHPLTEEQKASNRFLARYRIIVEHVMARLNKFQVLVQVFRHPRSRHGQIVRIVAGLVNRRTQVKPLKNYAAA